MIHALLLRLNKPGLYKAAAALKILREFVYCLALGTHDSHRIGRFVGQRPLGRHLQRIDRAKTRLRDILKKTANKYPHSKDMQLIRGIERIMRLVEKSFLEISDYKLAATHETVWFFGIYISLLDTLVKAITGCSSKSGEEAARASGLIAAGRKQLRLFRAGHLSQSENFLGNLKLTTLFSDFDKWLDESEKLLENMVSARKAVRGDTGLFRLRRTVRD
ncbi:MAG: hypothetical protein A2X34_05360 [Elusimicrobia bacterium GWC2_51_8]|nr:MAG: hypothetical protein A2X33_09125 [Elusimicrobia bacterium GWA2_51_34]OGR65440.1 MAG: hypothetical protein A2X34_05360 [Elusimicrobia bacterium GWC2_51_8]OGR84980.1 MAG: hypothetical protein A2021_08335 [Elusimicrobia bacterium GWF2_52_66]HAF95207.1 hypothetical protein [Elusimicrobiota bacterium]HCE97136.1 hypothetical protein [Elusimicrobiota bacterium]